MSKISLCMIVKNESSILQRSLESVAGLCDEIIIVDTGSSDNTVEIAKKFTEKVHFFEWIDDFSAARNFAMQFCSNEYVLTWDADYILEPESKQLILDLKQSSFDSKNLLYFRWFTEFNEQGIGTRSMWREFIFKKDDFHWESPIHNYLEPNPKTLINRGLYSNIQVQHWKDPTLKAYRYSQTKTILQKQLAIEPRPKDYHRLLLFYAQSLIFDNEFFEAITSLTQVLDQAININDNETTIFVLEKLISCWLNLGQSEQARLLLTQENIKEIPQHPRLLLLHADVMATENIQAAKSLYLQYLDTKYHFDTETNYDWDSERLEAHPYFILGKISLFENQLVEAKRYLQIFVQRTTNLSKKAEAIEMLKNL